MTQWLWMSELITIGEELYGVEYDDLTDRTKFMYSYIWELNVQPQIFDARGRHIISNRVDRGVRWWNSL
jgi:hypothetical protein